MSFFLVFFRGKSIFFYLDLMLSFPLKKIELISLLFLGQVLLIAYVKMELVTRPFRRHWIMLVELELTVLPSFKAVRVTNPTLSKITATMLSTAISKGRAKLHRAAILQALLHRAQLLQVSSILLGLAPALKIFVVIFSS